MFLTYFLLLQPQESLPDVYLWLIIEGKKIAYKRLKPEDLLYSIDENEKGKFCSKVESFFLKVSTKWTPKRKCKLDNFICFFSLRLQWLKIKRTSPYVTTSKFISGLVQKPKKFFVSTTYHRFSAKTMFLFHLSLNTLVDVVIVQYSQMFVTVLFLVDANEFEMRCHVFQGRSLIGSDESGLSDPFVRVSFNGQCQQSQVQWFTE